MPDDGNINEPGARENFTSQQATTMTVSELNAITANLVTNGKGDSEVAIDFDTFSESENGSILSVETAEAKNVQGVDDSGPVGGKFLFFVLSGSGRYLNEPMLRHG